MSVACSALYYFDAFKVLLAIFEAARASHIGSHSNSSTKEDAA
jgi:hypothetical protein